MSRTEHESPVNWARHTAPGIRALAADPGSVMVIPIGSIEQHGNHLPVATDTILVETVAVEAAEVVAEEIPVLVTPPISTGYSPHHLPFGGTLSVEFDHLLQVVCDTARTGLENGFDAVLLLNGHGGNIPLIGAATSIVGVDQSDCAVFGLTYFHLASSFIDDVRDSDIGGMGHAGEFETSLMMYLYPDLVDRTAIEGTPLEPSSRHLTQDMFERGILSAYQSFSTITESGAVGDPSTASRAKGEAIFEQTREALADVLQYVHDEGL